MKGKAATLSVIIVSGMLCVLAVPGFLSSSVDTILPIEITISPSTLILDSEGQWVTVHTNIEYGKVATLTLKLNQIEVAWTKADARGYLVVKFCLDSVKSIVEPPEAELTLTGSCIDGTPFEGADLVQVAEGPRR